METTVLVKAIRQVCLAQNSAAPDRRHARTGHRARCSILPDLLAKLRTRLFSVRPFAAISPDGPPDLAILPDHLSVRPSDYSVRTSGNSVRSSGGAARPPRFAP
jgi:hypothetical protein